MPNSTEVDFFSNCQHFINLAISFLNRSFNETVVESEVSSLEDVEMRKRPLKHETGVRLNFISSNGPYPLASLPLVKDFLTAYFGKDWQFSLKQ